MVAYVKEKMGEHMTIGVMIDYASYPQYPRSEADEARFKAGLKGELNGLYAHPYTPTLMMTPPASEHALHTNRRPYDKRGWTFVEARLSSMVKDENCLWDLSKLTGEETSWYDLYKSMRANRLPVMSPDRVDRELRGGRLGRDYLHQGVDLDLVLGIYRRGFAPAIEGMKGRRLFYRDLGWGDEVVPVLTEALQYVGAHCDLSGRGSTRFNFGLNEFTAEGKEALKAAATAKVTVEF